LDQDPDFRGIIDLLTNTAFGYNSNSNGIGAKTEIPLELVQTATNTHNALIDTIAESNEHLMTHYLNSGTLSESEFITTLSLGIILGKIFPVFLGSALESIGIDLFLDALVQLCPSAATRLSVNSISNNQITCSPNNPTTAYIIKNTTEKQLVIIIWYEYFPNPIKNEANF